MNIEEIIITQLERNNQIRNITIEMGNKLEQDHVNLSTYIYSSIGMAIAACIVITLIVNPFVNVYLSPFDCVSIKKPTLEESRSASIVTAIERAMDSEDYNIAIDYIDEALETSNCLLTKLSNAEFYKDEENLYEMDLEVSWNYQLRWMRIYALVRCNKYNEAICDLELFVTEEGEHQDEAKALLDLLRNNNKINR